MQSITVENISKLYHLGGTQVTSFRDLVSGVAHRMRTEKSELWALRDVSFEVEEGETLGIIGRNGAGKSTLLKILARITRPTSGRALIRGRVSSLLEVGTGFHMELSGRENIFLNGAVLGMSRREINQKFDEIVAFSEVEKFLDTPIKFYSTGMHMRLAFAVAAHLDPEILIVDEVLAVGDAEFQQKCMGKMSEVSRSGRTIIFVSHQLGSVVQLCDRAILLDKGQLTAKGPTEQVVDEYVTHLASSMSSFEARTSTPGAEMHITRARITDENGGEQSTFRHDQSVLVKVECDVAKMDPTIEMRMTLRNSAGTIAFTADAELRSLSKNARSFTVTYTIPAETLRPNTYVASLGLFVPHQRWIENTDDAVRFSVFDAGSKYAQSEGMDYGIVFSPCKITIDEQKN
jgi:lipopolysaccharide transport system ATP-binding protein